MGFCDCVLLCVFLQVHQVRQTGSVTSFCFILNVFVLKSHVMFLLNQIHTPMSSSFEGSTPKILNVASENMKANIIVLRSSLGLTVLFSTVYWVDGDEYELLLLLICSLDCCSSGHVRLYLIVNVFWSPTFIWGSVGLLVSFLKSSGQIHGARPVLHLLNGTHSSSWLRLVIST